MYLEAPSLTTAAVGHKMHNVIFLLPRPISTPTLNGSEGKQIQKSIFPGQETCLGFFLGINSFLRQETCLEFRGNNYSTTGALLV